MWIWGVVASPQALVIKSYCCEHIKIRFTENLREHLLHKQAKTCQFMLSSRYLGLLVKRQGQFL